MSIIIKSRDMKASRTRWTIGNRKNNNLLAFIWKIRNLQKWSSTEKQDVSRRKIYQAYYKKKIAFLKFSFIWKSSQVVKMQIEADKLTESKERVFQGLKNKIPLKLN